MTDPGYSGSVIGRPTEGTWQEDVRDVLHRLNQEHFTLKDVYCAEQELALRHPRNANIRPKIRQVIQVLEALGELDRIGRGHYRLLALAVPEEPTLEPLDETPEYARDLGVIGAPDTVPLERVNEFAYAVSAHASRENIKHEATLVHDYVGYLEARGHSTARKRIPSRSSGSLWTDLYDVTDDVLYEAKGGTTREAVRLALGQILDYDRYVHPTHRAALLPQRPSDDMCELLAIHAVGVAFRYKSSFEFENLTVS